MTQILEQNNVFFKPLQIVHDIINSEVQDPNSIRANKSTERERRWVFPTLPEANDENYPRVAIIHGNLRVQEWTAGQFDRLVKDESKNLARDIFSNLATLPVTIGIFVKKTRGGVNKLEVSDYDGQKRFVENSAQVVYLMDRIQKALHVQRENQFVRNDVDFDILDMEGAYQDNDFLWAGNINMDILLKNIWTKEYSPDKIIKIVDLTITPELTN